METTDVNDLHDRGRGETIRNRDRNTGAAHDIKRKGLREDRKEDRDTMKALEVWLERQELLKDATDNKERLNDAIPKEEKQSHGGQSTHARTGSSHSEGDSRDIPYKEKYPISSGDRAGAPSGKVERIADTTVYQGETQNPEYRGRFGSPEDSSQDVPKGGKSPKIKAWEVWLERQELNKRFRSTTTSNTVDGVPQPKTMTGDEKRAKEREMGKPVKVTEDQKAKWKEEEKKKAGKDKSDVEHGKYSNPGGTPEVGVSTDTKYDIPENTGYEERPHISVEEAGKLPRTTFNESGSELTVTGSQDSKDKPKFSQPADQEQPVRKAGIPQQHPNTYGMRYGMKGGVKKVWCPEHQVWEETRKDWHE